MPKYFNLTFNFNVYLQSKRLISRIKKTMTIKGCYFVNIIFWGEGYTAISLFPENGPIFT
jgi:hypothetical protein